jgi:hypothetical protein
MGVGLRGSSSKPREIKDLKILRVLLSYYYHIIFDNNKEKRLRTWSLINNKIMWKSLLRTLCWFQTDEKIGKDKYKYFSSGCSGLSCARGIILIPPPSFLSPLIFRPNKKNHLLTQFLFINKILNTKYL